LEPQFVDPATNKIILCVQSYVVRTSHHTILIDSCVGNHKNLPVRPMWHQMKSDRYEANFKAAGLSFEDIDFVMCTHLHTDHVGWNTRLEDGRWIPTFPNAKYVFADRELAFWTEKAKTDPESCPWVLESVLPIVDAKRVEMVRSDHWLNDEVQLLPSPGHTIDHFSVLVGKTGSDALITGDMVHSPLQARFPELGMMSDYDSELAGRTRREIFGRFCDTSTLMCTAHFPSPSTGRVRRWDDGFQIN
ncbi:MAG: MBL fold metallo-hydrolase, partial [Hyphomicrobiaceae bacterium]